MFLARQMAPSKVGASLFSPTIKYTFSGPYSVAATRLPVPSMFTSSPVSATPLALLMYTGAVTP